MATDDTKKKKQQDDDDSSDDGGGGLDWNLFGDLENLGKVAGKNNWGDVDGWVNALATPFRGADQAGEDVGKALWHDLVENPASGLAKIGLGRSDDSGSATPAKKKAAPAAKAPTVQVPTVAEQMMNGLINQYQQAMGTVNPFISGSNAGHYLGNAQAVASGASGGGVQAPSASESSMLSGDAAQVAAANNAGAKGITTALGNLGKATDLGLAASPYESLLSAMGSEANYRIETGEGTGFNLKGLPGVIQQLYAGQLALSGVGGGANLPGASNTSSTGSTSSTTPSSDTPENAGGGNA